MKVGVLSDTHGLLRPEVISILEGCDYILHAGDFDREAVLERLEDIAPVYAVRGNNDFGRWASHLPRQLTVTLGGVQFFMTHNKMDVSRKLGDAQVVVFGHSHQYFQQTADGRLWFNPGSCGYPRFGGGLSMAVMFLSEGQVDRIEKVVLQEEKKRGWS